MIHNVREGDKVILIGREYRGAVKKWAEDGALVLDYDPARSRQATIVSVVRKRPLQITVQLSPPNFGRLKVKCRDLARVKGPA